MMDVYDEQLQDILSDYPDSLSSEEKLEAVKDELNYDFYVPSTVPKNTKCNRYNPAIVGYLHSGLEWGEHGWEPIDEIDCLQWYPEYLPTDEALDVLTSYDHVLEVGAGNGYWAHVINIDGNCTPTDRRPEEIETGTFPTTITYPVEDGDAHQITVWSDVEEINAVEALTEYPDGPVLLCHPSGATRWAENVIDAIQQRQLILIAEWFPGADATPRFFQKLAEEWELTETFPVYDWASMHVGGYVFERADDAR